MFIVNCLHKVLSFVIGLIVSLLVGVEFCFWVIYFALLNLCSRRFVSFVLLVMALLFDLGGFSPTSSYATYWLLSVYWFVLLLCRIIHFEICAAYLERVKRLLGAKMLSRLGIMN